MSTENNTDNSSSHCNTLDLFFNLSPDLFCVITYDGVFEELNPAWESTLGYSLDDLNGKKFTDFIHPEDIDMSLIGFNSQLESFESISLTNRYRTINGEYKWLEWKGKKNQKDNRIYAIGRNVTSEKQLRLNLRQSEENYRILTENSNDLIMRFDRQYRHLYANPATLLYFGLPPEIFIGKNHQELGFPETEYTYWHSKMEEVFVTGKAIKEVVIIKNGTTYVDWSLIPEFDNEKRVVSVLSYSRDITDIMLTKKALRESENNLKQLNAEKDKFFSIIAHDLRSPFNGFLGLTDLLMHDIDVMNSDEIKDFATLMNKSARNLFSLLENLLEWAQMQNGLVKFNPVKVDLNEQITSILDTMEVTFKGKEISIISNLCDTATITADKQMLDAIFRNLISNAYKFTPRGGTIEISTRITNNKNIEAEIKDNGIGMSESMLKNLFSLSEKNNRRGTEYENTTGLGLLLVKEYTEKHNGKVSVTSQENLGTTFIVSLPLD